MSATGSRERIMDATVRCVERSGLGGFALEDVAHEAGVARATIYRHFDGGRDQLISETVTREVAAFWGGLAEDVAQLDGLENRLVHGLMTANERLASHDLLQRLLAAEPERIVVAIFESEPLVLLVLRGYFRDLLIHQQLRTGVEIDEAADYLTRMTLTHIGSHGRWDMADEAQVRELVRSQFLAGVLAPV